jgi:NDP-sugar pyrophosphorylase family protein
MRLRQAARLSRDKILNPEALSQQPDGPVLVLLAAGRGTRFGDSPKCIHPVQGKPLARHSIDQFRRLGAASVVCLVGHKHEEVSQALGADCIHVLTDNPTGGTAFAAFEAFCVPDLVERDALLVVTMGDRIVPASTFQRIRDTHLAGPNEATVTFLSAIYEPPRNNGKGRVLRRDDGGVIRIIEERDIQAHANPTERLAMLSLTEGNCPLYAIRAAALLRYLGEVDNDNAQGQFYLTDIIEAASRDGGDIRTVTVSAADPDYELLCADVTRPEDIAVVEAALSGAGHAAKVLAAGRTREQSLAIARQIQEIVQTASIEELDFSPDAPVAIGVSGGRMRIAFMHPDMSRFFGPAWQLPIGAGSEEGNEQIVVLAQEGGDGRVHLFPIDPNYRERVNQVANDESAYPGKDVEDVHAYEGFGTQMSEHLLLSLGYFTGEEVENRRRLGLPLPPPALWVGNSMRRPFALVMNALASMRTLRGGHLGRRVQERLGREGFNGLKLVSNGDIPRGGFSSSSAVVVAVENALNSLWDLGIPPDTLVHLACQAEYGTGVRAGSLDQATEQKGRLAQGTLMSSNPRDNFRVIATYPVPSDRYQILFPYTVDRDGEAWRWSWGFYGESAASRKLTTSEYRKMTGKAAEIAAHCLDLPADLDFFQPIERQSRMNGPETEMMGAPAFIQACSHSRLRSRPTRGPH